MEDIFDDLLNLEDSYYQDGYRLGVEDGSRAGRIEGRTFGLEKGFEKFFGMGKLQGKSQIWEARLPPSTPTDKPAEKATETEVGTSTPTPTSTSDSAHVIKTLPAKERLTKHIRALSALTELDSLSTENTEDAVSEFDDRLKRAAAKAKVIETIVGERRAEEQRSGGGRGSGVKLSRASTTTGGKNIEDFGVRGW